MYEMLKKLQELLGKLKKNEECDACSGHPKLCSEMMCLGTPGDMVRLIGAGYLRVLRIVPVRMVAIHRSGKTMQKDLHMVQLAVDDNGCVMHKEGKCLLMESGLTPLMGQLHHLLNGLECAAAVKIATEKIIMAWDDDDNAAAVEFCLRSVLKPNTEACNHTN